MTDFKEGDKVRVVFEGVWHEGGGLSGVNVGKGYRLNHNSALGAAKSIEIIERAGRPLEVGEKVVWLDSSEAIVVGAYKDMAWVLFSGKTRPESITGLNNLSRPCGTPITEAKS